MDITISIPDELAPGILASAALTGVTPQDRVQQVAIEMAVKTCQDLFVGPFYRGPVLPQFNADGTPYSEAEPPPFEVLPQEPES